MRRENLIVAGILVAAVAGALAWSGAHRESAAGRQAAEEYGASLEVISSPPSPPAPVPAVDPTTATQQPAPEHLDMVDRLAAQQDMRRIVAEEVRAQELQRKVLKP